MDTVTHKILDIIEHIWPPLAATGASMILAVKLWWADRRKTLKRVAALETIAENCVMREDLTDCRLDVDRTIEGKILPKIEQLRLDAMVRDRANATQQIERDRANALAHEKILIAMNRGDRK